jgi:lipopolysaccharide transport system ATP-binding protein
LKDVSFEVQPGEVVGIIGRNGAGKSTLLKIVSRITKPTKGRVHLNGRVGSLLEVGTGFHPELTGRENIYLNGSILGMSRKEIDRHFDEIVAFAEVERFLDTPVKRYSSGMYVRLAFSVAAHLQPEILIVDEVLAVGDATFQKKCLGKIGSISSSGRTALFVSHNLASVIGLCSSAYWIDRGRVQMKGSPRKVVDEYAAANIDQSLQVVDLCKVGRVDNYGASLKIIQIEWQSGLPLRHGEPARFCITVNATQTIEEASVGIGFASIEGTRLLTYDTDFDGERRKISAGETITVSGVIESVPLTPGIYAIDVGVRSGDRHGVDYLPSCLKVEVCAGENTSTTVASFRSAGVRLPAGWHWNVRGDC